MFEEGQAKGEKRKRDKIRRAFAARPSNVDLSFSTSTKKKKKTAYRVPRRRGVGSQQAPGRHRGHYRTAAKGRGAHQGTSTFSLSLSLFPFFFIEQRGDNGFFFFNLDPTLF